MAEVRVFVCVLAQHGFNRGDGFALSEFAEAHRGKETDTRGGVGQQLEQTVKRSSAMAVAGDFGRLSADFGIGIGKQFSESFRAAGNRLHLRRARRMKARQDLPNSPNGMDAS